MRNDQHGFTEEGDLQDRALDALLGRARTPHLRAGFADRVLHAAQCGDAVQHTPVEARRSILSHWGTRIALVAALIAVCFGVSFLQRSAPTPELVSEIQTTQPFQVDAALIQALQSNTLTADDLALVSTLGEVLDSDFSTQQNVWPD
ncbi:MAG: hypothetical protein WCL08_10800 [Verrucomicrobiota bacterium]